MIDGFIATKSKLSNQQLEVIAHLFITEFPAETLEDVGVFSRLAISGRFSTDFSYTALDPIVIFKWFREYLELKYQERERMIGERKAADKKNSSKEPLLLPEAVTEEQKQKTKELRDQFMKRLNDNSTRNRRRKEFADEQYLKFKKEYEDTQRGAAGAAQK